MLKRNVVIIRTLTILELETVSVDQIDFWSPIALNSFPMMGHLKSSQKTSPVRVGDCPRVFHGNHLAGNQVHTKALLFLLHVANHLIDYKI